MTLFQAQKSYDESVKERDEKIAMQEQYTLEILAQQNELDEKEGELQSQTEQIQSQDEKLKDQEQPSGSAGGPASGSGKNSERAGGHTERPSRRILMRKQLSWQISRAQIDQIVGVKAEVIEALRNEFAASNVNVDIDSQTGALTLDANVMFDYDQYELTDEGKAVLEQIPAHILSGAPSGRLIPSIWPRDHYRRIYRYRRRLQL